MATKLVSMKITQADRAAEQEKYATAAPAGDAYPYGLTVRLDNGSLEKLGEDVSEYAVGDKVMLIALAEVCETSSRESIIGGDDQCMTLQITKCCLEDAPAKDPASKLYNEEE